jgi:hypothetical protein
MAISWREIDADTSHWTLAGRTDTSGSSPEDLTSAMVQFRWRMWNQFTVNYQIRHQLAAWRPQAEPVLSQAPSGQGMLAVAVIERYQYGEQQLECNVAVTVYTDRTFSSPSAARQWYERWSGSLRSAASVEPQGQVASGVTRRFFYGNFVAPVVPRVPSADALTARGRTGSRAHVARHAGR